MKRIFWIGAAVAIVTAGGLQASSLTCSVTGSSYSANGCYTGSSFGPGVVNWGNAFGEAFSPTTSTGQANPHNAATPWGTVATDGVGVQVSLGPAQPGYISRFDNTEDAWSATQNGWVAADQVSQAEYGQNVNVFDGHFGGPPTGAQPGADPQNQYEASSVQFGDQLIGYTDSSGQQDMGGPVVLSFNSNLLSAGFRISSSQGMNSNFLAVVVARNSQGGTIGTYYIDATGSGGACASLTPTGSADPVACNDAPWIGFVDPNGKIASLYVEAFDAVTHADVAFLIDSLEVNNGSSQAPTGAPEPGMMALMGSGLVALAFFARKRIRSSR